ncbi:MAG: CPBP family intramembrane metalloprotease [Alphaproteobacteria bacterium]|nr:CPBP family intramembrane metalloprotease [Alphaproteobacteria bacterium]
MTDRTTDDAGRRVSPRRGAALDALFVLGTLFVIKTALLPFDQLWTYAGPISLTASAAVATWRLYRNREGWADLGLRRPAGLTRLLVWPAVVLVVTIAAGPAIELAVSSAGIGGAEIDPRYSRRFADLPGNTPMFVEWLLLSWFVGGFVEEMLFRGMLISRFERLLSGGPVALAMAVVLQSVVFGQQHFYYQGLSGALATGGIALLSGFFYVMFGRNLWPLVLSHGAANTIGLTLIYCGIQSAG